TLLNFASNSYLGISNDPRLIKAEHEADLKFGVGPGAVRFISGLYQREVYVVALTYPVVPKGQDTIRVQISASHTRRDLDYALKSFKEAGRKEGI
ncbi:unnamed protein product, partial [marine sediment metagenome]